MSPNKKNEEYVDLYGDLFEEGQVHSHQQQSAKTTTSSTKSSLDDEVLFFGQLGSLESEVKELRTVRQRLTAENEQLKASVAGKDRTIGVLRTNISSLYKTAKLELERRSAELAELRREYDTLIFRRRTGGDGRQETSIETEKEKENNKSERQHHSSSTRSSSPPRTPLSSTSARYAPYSSSSAHRKESATRPSTMPPLNRSQSQYSSRHSRQQQLHRNRLFD